MNLFLQIFFIISLLQANPLGASTNVAIPTHTPTFSPQPTQNVISEQKIEDIHFARSGLNENVVKQTPTYFSTTKQKTAYFTNYVLNFVVLFLEKKLSKSQVKASSINKQKQLCLEENRARVKLRVFVNGVGSIDITNFYTINKAIESKNLVLQHNLMQYSAGASIDEISAIHRYTVNNFELTSAAYNGSYNSIQQSWINLIESGLNKMRHSNQFVGTVYRGSNLDVAKLQRYLDAWNSPSKSIIEPPFLSSTKNPLVADDFIERFGVNKPNSIEVTFVINSKSGVYIDEISDYGINLQPIRHNDFLIQEEVLLNQNVTYRIDNIPHHTINPANGKTQYIIYMTEL